VAAEIRTAVAEGVKEGLIRAKAHSFSISKAPPAATRGLLESAGLFSTELQLLPAVPQHYIKRGALKFDWTALGEEKSNALACDTLEDYLRKTGVIFGKPDGFAIYDVHTERQFLSTTLGQYEVNGTTDAVIHPAVVESSDAARQARCIVDFKSTPNLKYSDVKAQAEAEFLAANSLSHHEVMVVFTDLETFGHILRADGDRLALWRDCDVRQTVFLMSTFLREQCSVKGVKDMMHVSVPGTVVEKSKRKETQDRIRALAPSAEELMEQLAVFRGGSLEDWMGVQRLLCGRLESPSFSAPHVFTPSYYS
jgi:hypothetical protein